MAADKAAEVSTLLGDNRELHENEALLTELVEFREMQVCMWAGRRGRQAGGSTAWCRQVQAGAGRRLGAGKCRQVQAGGLVQAGAGRCRQAARCR